MNALNLILGVLLGAVLVTFGVQNTQLMSFRFLNWYTPSVPVVLALAIALISGGLLSWLLSTPARFRGMRQRRDLEHRLADAEHRAAEASAEVQHRAEELVSRESRMATPPA